MDKRREGMTRREFLKRNMVVLAALAALAFFVPPLKAFAGIFKRQPRSPNVSDKEGRYYRRLAG